MFLHEVEMQVLMIGHVQVVAICQVPVILPAVSEYDFVMMLATSTEAVQHLCSESVSMVSFFKEFL